MLSQRHTTSSVKSALQAALCLAALVSTATACASTQKTSACNLASAPKQNFEMQVPFEVIDGRIYVQARVNQRGPFRFAVDTGASGQARADSTLVTALGLEIEKPIANSDGVKTAEVDTTRLASVEVGGLSRENLHVITRDYNSKMSPESALSGMLAREFFSEGLLIIDYPKKTLSFSRTLALSHEQEGVLKYERAFRVPVSIAGLHVDGNLDTGANVAFVLPKSVFDKVAGTPLQKAGSGQMANSQLETERSTVHGPFQIGEASLLDVEVRVSDRFPEVLVGAHALQSFKVLIDQRSKRVAICQ